jgi:hypothetical protein
MPGPAAVAAVGSFIRNESDPGTGLPTARAAHAMRYAWWLRAAGCLPPLLPRRPHLSGRQDKLTLFSERRPPHFTASRSPDHDHI